MRSATTRSGSAARASAPRPRPRPGRATACTLRRVETMRFLRGDCRRRARDHDRRSTRAARSSPRRVRWTERGSEVRAAEADAHARTAGSVSTRRRRSRCDAVPAELVPLLVRRDGRFAGPVFLPARGFVAGTGRIEPVAPGRLVARLALDADRSPRRRSISIGDGVPGARRRRRRRDRDARDRRRTRASRSLAVDLIAATAIPIAGQRAARLAARARRQSRAARTARPARAARRDRRRGRARPRRLPGELPAGDPATRSHAPRSRRSSPPCAAASRRRSPRRRLTSRDAVDATAGDCTTFALAYAALASAHARSRRAWSPACASTARARLVRHRWAVSWTGTRWIAVDAAFGAAPAGGDLIGLAVHDADDAGLVAGEAALTAVRSASWTGPD